MRKEFTAKTKGLAYTRSLIDGKPHCEMIWAKKRCGRLIIGGPEYDHIIPDGLGGDNSLKNCATSCGPCHKIKTHKHDNPVMRKADRQHKSGANIKPTKNRIKSAGFAKTENAKSVYSPGPKPDSYYDKIASRNRVT